MRDRHVPEPSPGSSPQRRTAPLALLLAAWFATTALGFLLPPGMAPWLGSVAPIVILSVLALVHGAGCYGWRGMALFFGIAVIVSNLYENLSILTGFPFGKYHHADWGMKIFNVPWTVGLTFFSLTYIAQIVALTVSSHDHRPCAGPAVEAYASPLLWAGQALQIPVIWFTAPPAPADRSGRPPLGASRLPRHRDDPLVLHDGLRRGALRAARLDPSPRSIERPGRTARSKRSWIHNVLASHSHRP